MSNLLLKEAPLGKQSAYISTYQADLLFPIPRQTSRGEIGIFDALPFVGCDIWNAYELSWLNVKGKPVVTHAEFIFPCESRKLIESKSFKLYLNSFNHTFFDSFTAVQNTLIRDLSDATGSLTQVKLMPLHDADEKISRHFAGICLDHLDIECDTYSITPSFLMSEETIVNETVYSDLLKSNCPITGQPDWGSVQITYTGKKINHAGLLRYLVSFRNHDEFHEHCIERIFVDIMHATAPEKLLVYGRYLRRGGLDINPYRANFPISIENIRLIRQ